jgi:LEA14-like dessication related protein
MRVRLFAMLLLVSFSLPSVGCKEVKQYLNNRKPRLKFQNMRLANINFRGMDMKFNFLMTNPNPIGINLSRISYQLDFNNNKLFSGTQRRGVQLKANGTSPLQMPFSIEYVKFVKSIVGFFKAKKEVPYALKLGVGFRVPVLGEVNIPFQTKGVVPIPSIPKIRVIGATKPRFTGSILNPSVSFNFQVGVRNQNRFPISVKQLAYSFMVSNRSVVSGQTQTMSVNSGKEQIVNIPVNLRVAQVGLAVINAVRSGKLNYGFNGNLNMGMFKLPINLNGNLNF